ncbi:MAG: hypothetical protein HY518_01355 [Candidatus Aenigmarchaeota archaeon]|nr:hypothetical protein [Candidatus Aenigmarchaeota archaeon]
MSSRQYLIYEYTPEGIHVYPIGGQLGLYHSEYVAQKTMEMAKERTGKDLFIGPVVVDTDGTILVI